MYDNFNDLCHSLLDGELFAIRKICKESLALLDCFLCESLATRGCAKEGKGTQLYSWIAVSIGKRRRVQ